MHILVNKELVKGQEKRKNPSNQTYTWKTFKNQMMCKKELELGRKIGVVYEATLTIRNYPKNDILWKESKARLWNPEPPTLTDYSIFELIKLPYWETPALGDRQKLLKTNDRTEAFVTALKKVALHSKLIS